MEIYLALAIKLKGVVREFGVWVDVKRISNFILVCNCPQFFQGRRGGIELRVGTNTYNIWKGRRVITTID